MKKTTLLLFIIAWSVSVFAQDSTKITFALDTIRSDSFYLLETVTFQTEGALRPRTEVRPTYFTDTLAFSQYVTAFAQRIGSLERQKENLAVEYELVTAQATALSNLRDSVFRGETGFYIRPALSQATPILLTDWYIPGRAITKARPLKNGEEEPEGPGYLLKHDGTFKKLEKPKIKTE